MTTPRIRISSLRRSPGSGPAALLAHSRERDWHDGLDWASLGRIAALIWLLGGTAELMLLPFGPPPTCHLGPSGWILAVGMGGAALAVGWRLLVSDSPPGPNRLLGLSYASLVGVLVLQLLQGANSPDANLLLLSTVFTACSQPPRRVLLFLLAVFGAILAPVTLHGWTGDSFSAALTTTLTAAGLAVLAMALADSAWADRRRMRDELDHASRLARADALTGLGNRRAFDEQLFAAVGEAEREGTPLSILVADVEGLKQINDSYGHAAGDASLQAVARAWHAVLRRCDGAFRWGGDEFATILPGSDRAAAELVARRVAAASVSAWSTPDGKSLGVRVGVADWTPGTTAAELLAAADQEMQRLQERASEHGHRLTAV